MDRRNNALVVDQQQHCNSRMKDSMGDFNIWSSAQIKRTLIEFILDSIIRLKPFNVRQVFQKYCEIILLWVLDSIA